LPLLPLPHLRFAGTQSKWGDQKTIKDDGSLAVFFRIIQYKECGWQTPVVLRRCFRAFA